MPKLKIDGEICKGCALCVISCPKKLLSIGKVCNKNGYFAAKIEDESACIACANCAVMCPDCAMHIEK